MALVTARTPLELTSGDNVQPQPLGVFARPTATTGIKGWLFSVDHKKVGILYGAASLFFFLTGGVEALLIRTQLARPGQKLLSADLYNQVFTMHGITMIFLVIMPMIAAFTNYLMPLQIGARDVAFPRLNAFSFWCFLFGALFLNSSWLLGGGPDGGWFNYAPNSGLLFSPSHGIDFYALGLIITGIASSVSAVNLIVTTINLRAPGMTWSRMPMFTWMSLVVQFLLLFSLPVITVALFLLMLDRLFGSSFFNTALGGDPMVWQHLFWIFGHPEVYILVLPVFGIVSEILPVFARKPLFGYPFMIFSGIAIGFMGFGVWAHHMFASGMGPMSVTAFSLATMFIAVPTGVKVLNWTATIYGGKLKFTTANLFSMGLIAMFTIGGLSGVTHAFAPADTQQTDTYYIVAHFHYVIFGGSLLGMFGGMYFWWPKAFGYKLREGLGKWHFWIMMIGFNLTFGPMHILGLQGMSRRIFTYSANQGFDFWNMAATIGAFIIAVSVAIFIWNVWVCYRDHRRNPVACEPDPWDARSLEWITPCPTPVHNFDTIPVVSEVDEVWHRKYGHDEAGRPVPIATRAEVVQKGDAEGVHLPSPSYWPIVLSAGLPLIGYGLIFSLAWAIPGGILVLVALFGWVMEPSTDPDAGHHDEHPSDAADGGDAAAELEGSEEAEVADQAEDAKTVELEGAPVG
ncbi:MAG: cytochrome c oxidase subunit I [Microthrixaceae bacterium]|nr:cytochrome c oxidase subunit I [Microthrixaceae bacterium]